MAGHVYAPGLNGKMLRSEGRFVEVLGGAIIINEVLLSFWQK